MSFFKDMYKDANEYLDSLLTTAKLTDYIYWNETTAPDHCSLHINKNSKYIKLSLYNDYLLDIQLYEGFESKNNHRIQVDNGKYVEALKKVMEWMI